MYLDSFQLYIATRSVTLKKSKDTIKAMLFKCIELTEG